MTFLPLYIALLWALALTPAVRELARRYGVLDHPDGDRKTHETATPLGGGVVVLLAVVFGILTVLWVNNAWATSISNSTPGLVPLALASCVIVLVGLLDDRFSLRGRQKLAGQLIAVSIVIVAGLRIERLSVFDWTIELGLLGLPFTVFWLLGAINALNLLDGADGFATCIGIIITAALAGIALIVGDQQSALIALALTGALLGFLAFNFPPSSIFLGDAGSMFIGLVVGVLTIQGQMKGPAAIVLATPAALLMIPILDSSAAIVRRWLGGKKLSTADRHHLHHVLHRQGFGPRGVLLVVSLLCCITAAGALLSVAFKSQACAFISIVAVLGILWVNDMFGYTELALLRSRLLVLTSSLVPDVFRNQARAMRHTRIGRRDSRVCRHMWSELRQFADRHELTKVRLDLEPAYGGGSGILWERRHHDAGVDNWQTRIPLATQGQGVATIEFTGSLDGDQARQLLASLGDLIESLDPDLQQLVDQQRVAQADEEAADGSADTINVFPRRLIFDRADIGGIKFDFLPRTRVFAALEYWRQRDRRGYITLTNPHSVMVCHRDRAMHDATTRAGLTLPDGVGTILAAKLLGYGRRHRVPGPALMLELCEQGRDLGYRHFFYGGEEGIAERLAHTMCSRFPGLQIAGTYCPPFRELTAAEDEQAVEAINSSRPDIVWVGLGAPKQEKWMAEHAMCIDATAMIGVGAAFDFHTGNVKWAPWIVRKTGMEWAYRLACDPHRMWRRNLDSPLFLLRVVYQLTKRLTRQILGRSAAPRIRSISWDLTELSTGPAPADGKSAAWSSAGLTPVTDEVAAEPTPTNGIKVG